MSKQIHIRLVERNGSKVSTREIEASEGPTQGHSLMRLLHVPEGKLFSVDNLGHIQRDAGAIVAGDVVFLREGREFYTDSTKE